MSAASGPRDAATPSLGDRRLGLVAFLAALAGSIVGSVLQFRAGARLGEITPYLDLDGKPVSLSDLPEAAQQIAADASVLTLLGYVLWGGFIIWAVVQGIMAVFKSRGRAWGFAAVILSAVSLFALMLFYQLGLVTGAAPFIDG